MPKRIALTCVALTALVTPPVIAVTATDNSDTIALSRYVEISTDVVRQQRNPMQTVVSINFPPNIDKVGQAINYAIKSTGYSIHELDMTPEETRIINFLREKPRPFRVGRDNGLAQRANGFYTYSVSCRPTAGLAGC